MTVRDLGPVSARVTNIAALTADFLLMLHGLPLLSKRPPLANLANLMVVVDRFDAVDCARAYLGKGGYLAGLDAKFGRGEVVLRDVGEEKVRMGLFTGIMLGLERWVAELSRCLVIGGSKLWSASEQLSIIARSEMYDEYFSLEKVRTSDNGFVRCK